MSAALLLVVLCGLSCIAFAPAYARLRAPLVVGAGLPHSFGALSAWVVPAHVGGR
jgi:hypothetical protein